MKFYIILIYLFTAVTGCKKSQKEPDFFFSAKVNGNRYIPEGCANCITCTILNDSIFIFGGNRGYESILIGFRDSRGITTKDYVLNDVKTNSGQYKNSTNYNDVFRTDSTRTGIFTLTKIDKANKIVAGAFHYTGFNHYQGSTINITDGRFRLNYTTY
jgi:hypothetical protein